MHLRGINHYQVPKVADAHQEKTVDCCKVWRAQFFLRGGAPWRWRSLFILMAMLGPTSRPALAFDDVPGVIPQPDAYSERMLQRFAEISPHTKRAEEGYFSRPVPRTIHQVTKDETTREAMLTASPWADYASEMGYAYRVWTLNEVELRTFADVLTLSQAMQALRRHGRDDAACQLMQLAILRKEGGIFVSEGAHPPNKDGVYYDLGRVADLRGLTVATSLKARDVGHMSVYLSHSFMAAPADHPWLQHVTSLATENVLRHMNAGDGALPARYLCGNAFLSRNLYGTFHVLFFTYLQQLGMFASTLPEGDVDAYD